MKNALTYRRATADCWPTIESLLLAARLPLDGARDHLQTFMVGENEGIVHCVGGYERYGNMALLRSMAVGERTQGQGIGTQLLDVLKSRARDDGIAHLFLLTTTAAGFFAWHGFVAIARDAAPAVLQASHQFKGACPASATLMMAQLGN